MSPNCANCFWKSVCWIQLISDPPPAATTFSWTPPNATEWTLKSSRKPWPRSLRQNEIKRRRLRQGRRAEKQRHRPRTLSFWRSASLHSAIFLGSEAGVDVSRNSPSLGSGFVHFASPMRAFKAGYTERKRRSRFRQIRLTGIAYKA